MCSSSRADSASVSAVVGSSKTITLTESGGEHLGDLHQLPGRGGQPLDDRVRVEVAQTDLVEGLRAPAAQPAPVEQPGAGRAAGP